MHCISRWSQQNFCSMNKPWGGASGLVGRAVASYTTDPRFESNHWQIFILPIVLNLYWKEEIKRK